MEEIIFFTTHCPKCKVLAAKLDAAGIQYTLEENIEVMEKMGIDTVPCLKVNENLLNFSEAIKWVNERA